MGRRRRTWVLISAGIGVLGLALLPVPLAYHSGDKTFTRVAGWANILALSVGLVALAVQVGMILADRFRPVSADDLAAAEDDIAASLLESEGEFFRLLIATGRQGIRRIDLRFHRRPGQYRTAGGHATGSLEKVLEFYQSLNPGRMAVVGSPGAGKTVLVTYLLIRMLETRREDAPIPLRLSLASLQPEETIEDWLVKQVSVRFPDRRRAVPELIRRHRILPILDGLDEMDNGPRPAARAEQTVAKLNGYFADIQAGPFVITCRTEAYDQLPAGPDDTTVVEIDPLVGEEIAAYLTRQFRSPDDDVAWLDVLAPLQLNTDTELSRRITSELSTPWALTLAMSAYRNNISPAALGLANPSTDGSTRDALLAQFVPSATALHRSYDAEQVRRWLNTLIQHLDRSGSRTDIVLHEAWPLAGPRRPRVLHAVLAGAATIAAIVSTAISIPDPRFLAPSAFGRYLRAFPHLEPTFVGAVLVVLLGAVALPAAAALTVARRVVEPADLRWAQLWSAAGLRRLVRGIAVGAAAGAVAGAALGLTSSLPVGWGVGVPAGAAVGVAAGLALGMVAGADPMGAYLRDPRDVLRGDLAHGLAYGSGLGLVGGIAGTIAVSPGYGLVIALSVATVYGLLVGPAAAVRYAIAIALASRRGRLPLRLGRFLDWGVSAGLLRTSGVAYQFRHEELRRWLERQAAKP